VPRVLNCGVRPLHPRGKIPATCLTGGWVGPRAPLDGMKKRNNYCPCREAKPGLICFLVRLGFPIKRSSWLILVPFQSGFTVCRKMICLLFCMILKRDLLP
jgi:hypothetical protein